MAKKKKLLNNFQEIIDSGDMEAFQKVFEKCEISATAAGKTSCNAFSYKNLTPAHIRFLAENGLDVNSDCGFGYPAIAFQASDRDNLRCLLDHGADPDLVLTPYRETALARACSMHDAAAVRNLLEAGASVSVTGGIENRELIDLTLVHCDNIFIPQTLAIIKMLKEYGAKTTVKTSEYVRRIGERFEFFRDSISPDMVDELSASLEELYSFFDVPPVPSRRMHDGMSAITVKGSSWQEQYNELWEQLVPGTGKAKTVQGEMIRIAGRVSYEILDNGGINWDDAYKKMLHALSGYISLWKDTQKELVREAEILIGKITPSAKKKTLYRLTEIIVRLVLSDPEPIPLGDTSYTR